MRIAGGGWLIDTPGMRELRLTDAAKASPRPSTTSTSWRANCRFPTARTQREPGCAVRAALDAGRARRRPACPLAQAAARRSARQGNRRRGPRAQAARFGKTVKGAVQDKRKKRDTRTSAESPGFAAGPRLAPVVPARPPSTLSEPVRGAACPNPTAYQVLARKYRPQTFADLIGQEAMVRTLRNAFAADRIAHAFVMTGVRGVGKTTTARIIAKGLNCIGPDGSGGPTIEPCGECEPLPRHRRRPPCRRAGDGRGLAHSGRETCARSSPRSPTGPTEARYKIYHHRRSAHAVDRRLQRAAEDAGRTARACEVHLRHHRDPQGAGHHPVALPALRPAPDRARGDDGAPAGRSWRRKARAVADDALALITRAAEGSVRDAMSPAGPGDRAWRGRDHAAIRFAPCWGWPTGAACSTSSTW